MPIRYLSIICVFLLSACADPVHREVIRQPWDSQLDQESGYAFAQRSSLELIQEAEDRLKTGDMNGALISFQKVILHEAWHLKAHEHYQDFLIKLGKSQELYREYQELLWQNPDSGAALYLFMRSLFYIHDVFDAKPFKAFQEPLSELYQEAQDYSINGNSSAALEKLEILLKKSPNMVQAHLLYQDITLKNSKDSSSSEEEQEETYQQLVADYQVLANSYESDGNFRYLYERLVLFDNSSPEIFQESCLRYAQDFALGLPGYWLYYGFAQVAWKWSLLEEGWAKQGLLKLALELYDFCLEADQEHARKERAALADELMNLEHFNDHESKPEG